jgi:hypothetical protein
MPFRMCFNVIAASSVFALLAACSWPAVYAQTKAPDTSKMPWKDKALSPDERADMVQASVRYIGGDDPAAAASLAKSTSEAIVLGQMTLDEKSS